MKLKIIAKLWSAVYDLLFYIDGKSKKVLIRYTMIWMS